MQLNLGQVESASPPPLNAAHYDALINAQRSYHDLLAELDKADQCGVACQHVRSAAVSHNARIQKLLGTYFPNGRPTE